MVEKVESLFWASPAGVNYIRAVSPCSPLFRFVFLYAVSLCVSFLVSLCVSCHIALRFARRFVSRIALAYRRVFRFSLFARGRWHLIWAPFRLARRSFCRAVSLFRFVFLYFVSPCVSPCVSSHASRAGVSNDIPGTPTRSERRTKQANEQENRDGETGRENGEQDGARAERTQQDNGDGTRAEQERQASREKATRAYDAITHKNNAHHHSRPTPSPWLLSVRRPHIVPRPLGVGRDG